MQTLAKDIRFGLRVLRNSPGLTLVAVLTLALGIAVNTTVFSWIDSVLLNPYPWAGNPERLVLIETVTPGGEYLVNTSYLDYRDYRDNLTLVSGVAVGRFTPLSVGADGKTERAWAELVSANFFDVLQVKPVLGRAFLPEEAGDEPGAHPVAVISYNTWQNRFQGDPGVLGKTIRLNRNDLTIVGVAPEGFSGTTVGLVYDVWMPVTMATAMGTGPTLTGRGTRDLTSTIARLKPGVTVDQARAEISALARRLADDYPKTNRGIDLAVVPIGGGHLGAQGLLVKPLRILMAVCLLLLVVVCANVANLLLARAVSRRREFGVRTALGAQPVRLMRQMLTETLLLAGAGGVVAVVLVMWMSKSLVFLLPALDVNFDIGGEVSLTTLGFTLLVAVAATLASGLGPALLSARTDLNETLKEGGRSGGSGTHSHRLRTMLVVTQVALATVALIGAVLFHRSFENAGRIDPGFNVANTSVSQFYLSNAGYSAEEQRQFCRELRGRIEGVPGVTGVTYSDVVPLSVGGSPWHRMEVEGYVPAPNEQMMIHRAMVPPGYFEFMDIPLREGRDFTELDDAGRPVVIIVNETFARRFFPGGNPIGRRVLMEGRPATVVGVAGDSKYHTPLESPMAFFYVPFRQRFAPGLNFSVFIKAVGDPMRITPALRREALTLNQDAVFNTRPLSEAIMFSLYPQKVAARLLSVVGLLCLLLAAVGLYSVMSYSVSQRTQELGIRMALGARPGWVCGLVVGQGLLMTLPGILAGVAAALAASRLVMGMLVEVDVSDPSIFLAAAVFLGLVAVLASYLPARRAALVNPIVALRRQ